METTNIAQKLTKNLKPLTDEQNANAAVALLLLENPTPTILFVKRAHNPADPWSTQMALPGGKRDPRDTNLKQTVLRETLEETGINLQHCHFLGVLKTDVSTPRPEIRVLPYIILLEHKPAIKLNRQELEKHTWIPIEKLAKHKTTTTFSFGSTPAYVVNSDVIWGLTYRIVEELMRILKL
jgi:8-oxo-dGTP pyrophosphatase MutT (NUDIX family)